MILNIIPSMMAVSNFMTGILIKFHLVVILGVSLMTIVLFSEENICKY
jgi:Zn-dependent membrane protease YugP